MPGPLTNLTFPTPAELLTAGWTAWWKQHKLPPSPKQLLTFTADAFYDWRNELMLQHSAYLADHLGTRLLPLFDHVTDLVLEHVDCRGWEFPDAEDDDATLTSWIAWALTCLRWTLVYEPRNPDEVTPAAVATFLLQPPPRPATVPPPPRYHGRSVRPRPAQPALFS